MKSRSHITVRTTVHGAGLSTRPSVSYRKFKRKSFRRNAIAWLCVIVRCSGIDRRSLTDFQVSTRAVLECYRQPWRRISVVTRPKPVQESSEPGVKNGDKRGCQPTARADTGTRVHERFHEKGSLASSYLYLGRL